MIRRSQGSTAVWVASWTQFNKVKEIHLNSATFAASTEGIRFTYGPDNQRLTEETREGGVFTRKQRYLGPFEQILHSADGSDTDWDLKYTKIYVGGYGVYTYDHRAPSSATSPISRHWFHGDHLGSIIGVTNSMGELVEENAYDAWGNPRNASDWSGLSAWPDYEADEGFTGHEMMSGLELVHMNGRVYDPLIGRFLSPDIFIQAAGNLQNYNRYSYVLNNPLKYVDPSGNAFFSIVATLVAAAGKNWAAHQ